MMVSFLFSMESLLMPMVAHMSASVSMFSLETSVNSLSRSELLQEVNILEGKIWGFVHDR